VLRWWFRDKFASLVVDSSLIVEMTSDEAKHKQWTIYVTGSAHRPAPVVVAEVSK